MKSRRDKSVPNGNDTGAAPGSPKSAASYVEPSTATISDREQDDLERLRVATREYGEVNNALHDVAKWCLDLTLTCMTTDGVSEDLRKRARAAHATILKYRKQYDLRSRAEVETGNWDLAIDSPNYEAFRGKPASLANTVEKPGEGMVSCPKCGSSDTGGKDQWNFCRRCCWNWMVEKKEPHPEPVKSRGPMGFREEDASAVVARVLQNSRFAKFGRELFDLYTERVRDMRCGEYEEEVMEVAEKYDLVRKERYDPARHGEGLEVDAGDYIWSWIHLDAPSVEPQAPKSDSASSSPKSGSSTAMKGQEKDLGNKTLPT